jgi:hypothetical protein
MPICKPDPAYEPAPINLVKSLGLTQIPIIDLYRLEGNGLRGYI